MFDPNNDTSEICKEYSDLKFWVKYIKLVVTIFMSVCNALSKKLILWIISMLNLKKRTEETLYSFIYLLSVTAFTSIFVILLLGAKLDFVPIIGRFFTTGTNRDFTWEWYLEIGGLFITRQIVLSIGPIIETVSAYPADWVKKFMFKRKGLGNSEQKSMW